MEVDLYVESFANIAEANMVSILIATVHLTSFALFLHRFAFAVSGQLFLESHAKSKIVQNLQLEV